jgi:hypothetical protein
MQHESTASSVTLASIDDKAVRNKCLWGANPKVVTAIQSLFSISSCLAGKHSVSNASFARQDQRLFFGSTVSPSECVRVREGAF